MQKACNAAGFQISNHFNRVNKMVPIGSGASGKRADYYLTKYACYLIAMNGQSGKPEISAAQTYFAAQTHRQEVQDQEMQNQLTEDEKRVQGRERVKNSIKHLNSAAKDAGVTRYAIFHNEGYRGLYGMNLSDIKQRKGLDSKEDLLDRVGREELAANEFRATQTEKKLKVDKVKGELEACTVHRTVGAKVRATIREIGGTMPEDLPAEPHIKTLTAKKRGKALPPPKPPSET